jgi:hypothetical protein
MSRLQNNVGGLVRSGRRLWPANSEDMRREEEGLRRKRRRIFIRPATRRYATQDVCDFGDSFQESEASVVRTVSPICREETYWGPIRAIKSSLYAEGTVSSPGGVEEGFVGISLG